MKTLMAVVLMAASYGYALADEPVYCPGLSGGVNCTGGLKCCGGGMEPMCYNATSSQCCGWYLADGLCGVNETCCGSGGPGASSEVGCCPPNNTCCGSENSFGCCPNETPRCCPNGFGTVGCCPHNTTCCTGPLSNACCSADTPQCCYNPALRNFCCGADDSCCSDGTENWCCKKGTTCDPTTPYSCK
eukprot:TRINITY_DN1725_c0_g1_i1.p1 TRINITY_DN1725_c0_g1~~TRINITY_DN1725_c0_g1_i1.p1  ORF type:complete len:188 (+),score=12.18 TRINITY_DN1725_c0_g1_i1:182-745(+)